MQPAEHPVPSAAVRRREFIKGTVALYLTGLGNAAHALRPGPEATKKIHFEGEHHGNQEGQGRNHQPKAPRTGSREPFASILCLQLRTRRWLPARVSHLSPARGPPGTLIRLGRR